VTSKADRAAFTRETCTKYCVYLRLTYLDWCTRLLFL